MGWLFTFCPFIIIDPKSGEIKPVIRLNIVVFPTPLGPNKPKICPLFNLIDKLSKIIFLPNFKEIFSSYKIDFFSLKYLILNFFILYIKNLSDFILTLFSASFIKIFISLVIKFNSTLSALS